MKKKPKFRLQIKSPKGIRWRGMAWTTDSKRTALAEVRDINDAGASHRERVYSYQLRRPLTMEDVA